MQASDTKGFPEAEWEVRVDCAAAHRLAVLQGLNEGIYNHITAAVPGKRDRFLLNPFGWYWSEITANSLVEVGFDGKPLTDNGLPELSAYCVHAPIYQARPDAGCVIHIHTPFSTALTLLEDPRLLPVGQGAAGLIDMIAYDNEYPGRAMTIGEGHRLASVLGDKNILMMGNHGVVVLGESVAQAYDRVFYLERCCQVQLYAMWTGRPMKFLPEDVLAAMREQKPEVRTYYGKRPHELHFDALKRVLDTKNPGYRE